MKVTTTIILASLATVAIAAKNERTFAVLRFDGDGFMTEGRVDPIVNPGAEATHLHGIMGGSNFGKTVEGDQLLQSKCTNAKIANDFSNYWAPEVFFQDPKNGSFEKVPLFYMNVYYFFEPTDDEIKSFPVGLKMLIGDAKKRDPPASGAINLDPATGEIQPIQFTCPRSSYVPASYPANSDGTMAGMVDPHNVGSGAGFPLYPCDGYASPLRQDIHFPSCYNPGAGLDDYKNNMKFPEVVNGKQNCPDGWTHVPHIFYELYWNTPLFNDRWTPDGKTQPFVLSNGDATGYSSHADFISGWKVDTLQTIIDTCNAGSVGMDTCPTIPGGLNQNGKDCRIESAVIEAVSITSTMEELPGNNPVTGWGKGGVTGGTDESSGSTDPAPSSAAAEPSQLPVVDNGAKAVVNPAVPDEPEASSTAQKPSQPTAAPADSNNQTASPAEAEGNGKQGNGMITKWDYVTVTATTTQWVDPTPVAKRHEGHMARHMRAHRLGRL